MNPFDEPNVSASQGQHRSGARPFEEAGALAPGRRARARRRPLGLRGRAPRQRAQARGRGGGRAGDAFERVLAAHLRSGGRATTSRCSRTSRARPRRRALARLRLSCAIARGVATTRRVRPALPALDGAAAQGRPADRRVPQLTAETATRCRSRAAPTRSALLSTRRRRATSRRCVEHRRALRVHLEGDRAAALDWRRRARSSTPRRRVA